MSEHLDIFLSSHLFQLIGLIADASIIVVFITWVRGLLPKKFHLNSTGNTYSIRHKDFTVQNVTNGISRIEYNGGSVPDNVRAEIIKITKNSLKQINQITRTESSDNISLLDENTENHGSTDEKRPD